MILTFTSNSPDKSSINVVTTGVQTGYAISDTGPDFGSVVWDATYAGSRGTQGSKPGFGIPENRTVSVAIRSLGTSKDDMTAKVSALTHVVDDIRRFGGTVLWQSTNQTRRQYFFVLTANYALKQWDNTAELNNTIDMALSLTCAPYAEGDAMDTNDSFDSATLSDYTSDVNTAAVMISGGDVNPTVSGNQTWRARHTVKNYPFRDAQITLKLTTGTTITSGVWGVTLRYDTGGADTGLVCEYVAGTNVLRIRKLIAGTATQLSSVSSTPATSTTYWIRFRAEGNVLTGELFLSTPTPTGTPSVTTSYALTAAEAARFYIGHPGVRITTAHVTEAYDDLVIEPFTYRLGLTPEELVLGDSIPGDVAPKADIVISPLGGPASGDAGTAPIWGKAAWYERPHQYNLCTNGDFEAVSFSGWTNAAVTNIMGASTSIAVDTADTTHIKYGSDCLKCVCPATSGTGTTFTVYHRAKKGRTYALAMWLSGSVTTNSSLVLGFNDGADVVVESATALATTPVLRTITWTPTADRDVFYAGVKITAATATNLFLDGVNILESPSIALSAAISSSSATTLSVYANPGDLPPTPFNALVGTEIIRVTDTTTTTWTIGRGLEGTTAATAAQDAPVIILPTSSRQYQGRGAQPPAGIIEGESYIPSLSSTTVGALSVASDSASRGGNKVHWSAGGSGSTTLAWYVDPSLLVPDDYFSGAAGGEVDIEVWARIEMASGLGGPFVRLSCLPEGGLTTGSERFTREYGQGFKPLTLPSAQNFRYCHLGTLPMYVDRKNPLRWILKLFMSQSSTGAQFNVDYLFLNLSRNRVCSITGHANDTQFPQFIPDAGSGWSNTSTMTKTLKSDGTAYINEPTKPTYPDSGLGRVIELGPGVNNGVIKLSNRVPDDTTASVDAADMDDNASAAFGTTGSYTTTVHFAVTPRYGNIRGN